MDKGFCFDCNKYGTVYRWTTNITCIEVATCKKHTPIGVLVSCGYESDAKIRKKMIDQINRKYINNPDIDKCRDCGKPLSIFIRPFCVNCYLKRRNNQW